MFISTYTVADLRHQIETKSVQIARADDGW